MGAWVLIVTLFARESAIVNSIPGFASQADCQHAGEIWAASEPTRFNGKAVFVCVTTNAETSPQK